MNEDYISRQAAKRALEDRFMELQKRHDDKRYETNYCLNTILELPSVNPQKLKTDVLDKLDEIITDALDNSTDQKESQTLRWVLDKISEVT